MTDATFSKLFITSIEEQSFSGLKEAIRRNLQKTYTYRNSNNLETSGAKAVQNLIKDLKLLFVEIRPHNVNCVKTNYKNPAVKLIAHLLYLHSIHSLTELNVFANFVRPALAFIGRQHNDIKFNKLNTDPSGKFIAQ